MTLQPAILRAARIDSGERGGVSPPVPDDHQKEAGRERQGQKAEGQQQGEPSGADPRTQGDSKQPGTGQKPGEGERPDEGKPKGDSQGGDGQQQSSSLLGGGRETNNGRAADHGSRPLTGNEFTEWSDQLRDIEEMLGEPDLRNRVAQVRDRARAMRADFKRHGEQPRWDLVKSQLLGEMQALQQRIIQELAKRESDRAMVPIDREPVPEEFDALVQKYYELLGREWDN